MSNTDFSTLPLHPELLSNLASLNYETMTPIQAGTLPPMLDGKDVIGQGKTGSGKTAAFGLGLLQKLELQNQAVQALVLCPTRELADQVAGEIRRLARGMPNVKVLTLCGGMPFGPQVGSLQHGAHIVVGTPGRIGDHLRRNTLQAGRVQMLVLDEADRMLEMGFQAELDGIIDQLSKWRQTLLFSATFPEQIGAIARRIMRKPVTVEVESNHDTDSIAQYFYELTDNKQYLAALRLLLLQYQPESSVVFCNTKKESREISEALCGFGFSAMALNGDLEQRDRDQIMVRFANRSISVLVATDVAARGLDIEGLDAVFNYHLPHEPETYIHRIGRTGRAGSRGSAFTLHNGNEYKLTVLKDYLGHEIENGVLPSQQVLQQAAFQPVMVTLQIGGGKKQKIRPGDILGALTSPGGIAGKEVGKIRILDHQAYVAVERKVAARALNKLTKDKLKGRSFRVRQLDEHSGSDRTG